MFLINIQRILNVNDVNMSTYKNIFTSVMPRIPYGDGWYASINPKILINAYLHPLINAQVPALTCYVLRGKEGEGR